MQAGQQVCGRGPKVVVKVCLDTRQAVLEAPKRILEKDILHNILESQPLNIGGQEACSSAGFGRDPKVVFKVCVDRGQAVLEAPKRIF